MKRLLHSIIDFDQKVTQENLIFNFEKLRSSGFKWWEEDGRQDDERIYTQIQAFFEATLELPSIQTLRDHFEAIKDIEVLERLKTIEVAQGYTRTNFTHLLKTLHEEHRSIAAIALLRETHAIIAKGLEVNEGGRKVAKKGRVEGLTHLLERAQDLLDDGTTTQIRGDVRLDGQIMVDEYRAAELAPPFGAMTGIEQIDVNCRGAKCGELWVHAAFAGELKSTHAANWCTKLVTHYKNNVVYISLEMPREQIRRNIYTIHAASPKWARRGYAPLDYRKIRDGELTREERDFYLEKVIPDFCNNPDHCVFEVLTPNRDVSMDDIRMEVELLHRKFDVQFVVIDYGQWVEARKSKKSRDYVVELNSVVRDAKRFAMTFAGGRGVPVLLLWQINREGKEAADKNDGVYTAKALTYANEVEKTADVITTSYLNDDLRRAGMTKFSNLKNRDNPIIAPFLANVDFTARRISSAMLSSPTVGMSTVEDLDAI